MPPSNCLSDGLEISQDGSNKYIGELRFYWQGVGFPRDYSVQVQIDLSRRPQGCAGINTRTDQDAASYSFQVCSDGYWRIERFDSQGGKGHLLGEGSLPTKASYLVEADAHGSQQSLELDGTQVGLATDGTLTDTDHIALVMFADEGQPGAAVFSHFVFTSLP